MLSFGCVSSFFFSLLFCFFASFFCREILLERWRNPWAQLWKSVKSFKFEKKHKWKKTLIINIFLYLDLPCFPKVKDTLSEHHYRDRSLLKLTKSLKIKKENLFQKKIIPRTRYIRTRWLYIMMVVNWKAIFIHDLFVFFEIILQV